MAMATTTHSTDAHPMMPGRRNSPAEGRHVVAVAVRVRHQLPLHGELQLAGGELSVSVVHGLILCCVFVQETLEMHACGSSSKAV